MLINKKKKKTTRYYEWLAHVMCHFSKFHILWAQETKTMEETADCFERFVLAYFGLPKILQSDNGSEFRNQYMRNKAAIWDGECKIIHGRARHPESQGLVENGNGTAENKLTAMMHQLVDKNWVNLIPQLQSKLNTQKSSGKFIIIF